MILMSVCYEELI